MTVKTEFSNKIFICTCNFQTIYVKDPAYDQCSQRENWSDTDVNPPPWHLLARTRTISIFEAAILPATCGT